MEKLTRAIFEDENGSLDDEAYLAAVGARRVDILRARAVLDSPAEGESKMYIFSMPTYTADIVSRIEGKEFKWDCNVSPKRRELCHYAWTNDVKRARWFLDDKT